MPDAPTRPRPAMPAMPDTDATGSHALSRTAYADQLAGRWLQARSDERPRVGLRDGEAEVIARLLEELAGTYPDEPLGRLSHRIAELLGRRAGRTETS